MDQIAVMGLKALQAYKEQLDEAKKTVDVARALVRKMEIFEVTIGMIPKRGNKDDVGKITGGEADKKKEESKGLVFQIFLCFALVNVACNIFI